MVRDLAPPRDICGPLKDLMAPGETMTKLAPIDSMLSVTLFLAPLPIAVMVITEAIPIMIPSIVNPVLALFDLRETKVSWIKSLVFIIRYLLFSWCV